MTDDYYIHPRHWRVAVDEPVPIDQQVVLGFDGSRSDFPFPVFRYNPDGGPLPAREVTDGESTVYVVTSLGRSPQ